MGSTHPSRRPAISKMMSPPFLAREGSCQQRSTEDAEAAKSGKPRNNTTTRRLPSRPEKQQLAHTYTHIHTHTHTHIHALSRPRPLRHRREANSKTGPTGPEDKADHLATTDKTDILLFAPSPVLHPSQASFAGQHLYS